MKVFKIIVLLFLLYSNFYAQENHPRYSILYALHQSNNTNSQSGKFTPGLCSSIFAKMEFGKKPNLKYSVGFGYLQSHTVFKDYTGLAPYLDEERHYHLDYLTLPIGVNIKVGDFYIHPEIGFTYNFGLSIKSYIIDADMERTGEVYRDEELSVYYKKSFANFLALGYAINIGKIQLLTALKGFIAFNPRFINTYGVGLETGFRF